MRFEDLLKIPEIQHFTAPPEDGDYDAHTQAAMKAVFEYQQSKIDQLDIYITHLLEDIKASIQSIESYWDEKE